MIVAVIRLKLRPMPTKEFRNALKWILSECGQLVRVESCSSTYIRSLEGDEWCVGKIADDDSIENEACFSNVGDAIDDYIKRVTQNNSW